MENFTVMTIIILMKTKLLKLSTIKCRKTLAGAWHDCMLQHLAGDEGAFCKIRPSLKFHHLLTSTSGPSGIVTNIGLSFAAV